ncbi:MAG TPA: phosphatase PAP2 family protein, partial [Bdellovibrionota bacterium]
MNTYFTILALLLPLSSLADWSKIPSSSFSLDGPPRKGSPAYERDFELLHRYQNSRSKEQCKLAQHQEHPTYDVMFASQDSPLSKEEAKKAEELVSKVMKLSVRIAGYFKDQYHRPRPFNVDSTLTPCAKKPGGETSYPSSHASASWAGACVLAEIYSDKEKDIKDYGKSLGDLRAIVGVHHPSDVAAGQAIG